MIRRKNKPYFRPRVDQLEQRAMLAADVGFTPDPIPSATAVNITGAVNPFLLASDFSQSTVAHRTTDPQLGIQLGQNTLNENGPAVGRYLFTAALETTTDPDTGSLLGTLNRTDLATGEVINLLDIAVDETDTPLNESTTVILESLYAVRWTPWGTLLVAESVDLAASPEAGELRGLVYEIFDPTSAQPHVFARPALGSMNFQGIDIDSQGVVYVDDFAGSASTLYRFIPDGLGVDSPLESGELQVLDIDSGGFGDATWTPIDSFAAAFDVRDALLNLLPDEFSTFSGTRDLEVGHASLGEDDLPDEVLYVAIQGDNRVILIDLDGQLVDTGFPVVYDFVNQALDAEFNDPVDLSSDASGRLFIGEAIDPPPGVTEDGNDVWVANDLDDDVDDNVIFDPPVADQLERAASLRVAVASIAGLYVNPFNPSAIYVNSSSTITTRNGIFLLENDTEFQASVTEVDTGNGNIVLSIVGSENSDRIVVSGNNLVSVRIGNKTYNGLAPSTSIVIYGRGGSDSIVVANRSLFEFTIFGGEGSDYIAGSGNDDTISGDGGNDRINGGHGNNNISGGDGNDSISSGSGNDTLYGDAGLDRINGGNGDDIIDGGTGNDTLYGGLGEDIIFGNTGNDYLDGYFGDDVLVGGIGADYMRGGSGQDVLLGGTGADFLLGGDGEDLLIGDPTGADTDLDALRALHELWFFNSFNLGDRATNVSEFFNNLDGDPVDGLGITSDNSKDILDGGAGEDLFYIFLGKDVAQFINQPGDEVVEL